MRHVLQGNQGLDFAAFFDLLQRTAEERGLMDPQDAVRMSPCFQGGHHPRSQRSSLQWLYVLNENGLLVSCISLRFWAHL